MSSGPFSASREKGWGEGKIKKAIIVEEYVRMCGCRWRRDPHPNWDHSPISIISAIAVVSFVLCISFIAIVWVGSFLSVETALANLHQGNHFNNFSHYNTIDMRPLLKALSEDE